MALQLLDGEAKRFAKLTSFLLKIIAIIGMTASHAGVIFEDALPFGLCCILLAVGGVTFPIMGFLVSEGYRHTSDVRRYALRLLAFAGVAQIPYQIFLAEGAFEGNVLFTLFIGLSLIYLNDRMPSRPLFLFAFLLGCLASALCDWGVVGVIMVFLYQALKNPRERILYPALLPMIGIGSIQGMQVIAGYFSEALPNFLYAVAGCGASIPLLNRYDGRRGKPLKLFFYIYYPAHILVLGLLHDAFFGPGLFLVP